MKAEVKAKVKKRAGKWVRKQEGVSKNISGKAEAKAKWCVWA